MIMSLCKNTIHSFLSLSNTSHMDDDDNKSLAPPPATSPAASIPLFSLPSVFSKKDPGGIGFIDDMGGGVDGLMSCTESLGFESSDERIDHQMEEEMDERITTTHHYYDHHHHQALSNNNNKDIWRKDNHHHHQRHHNHEVKKFPPPLSSFNRNGQPSLFLRSVRSDGRLELTEVRIDRPEILRASREDGRLRLHLITEDEDEDDEVGINSEYNEYEQQQDDDDDDDEETLEEEEEEEEKEEEETLEEEEERVGEWKLEGFRRCKEVTGPHDYQHHHLHCHHHHQQHSHLHVWSQQCVPTR